MLFVEEPDRGVGETSADAGSGDGTDAMKGEGTPKIDLPVAVDRPFRGFGLGGGLVVVGPGGRGEAIGESQHRAAFEGRQVVRDHQPVERRPRHRGRRAERDVWHPGDAHFSQGDLTCAVSVGSIAGESDPDGTGHDPGRQVDGPSAARADVGQVLLEDHLVIHAQESQHQTAAKSVVRCCGQNALDAL